MLHRMRQTRRSRPARWRPSLPAGGSATIRNMASPPATATAPSSSRAAIRRLSSQAPIGNANTRLVARIGWTTTSRPAAKAAAWQMKPAASLAIPASHAGRRASRSRNPSFAASSADAEAATRCCRTVPSAKNSAAASARGISIHHDDRHPAPVLSCLPRPSGPPRAFAATRDRAGRRSARLGRGRGRRSCRRFG